ncbi:cobalamin B12-binding domain-containing protein [Brotaphodocola sp.]|uniref:cobalamin B12-binding domain-containing protein n=1 Tax=Brotaphodocola sp. TaxID=3073577 RepID=UPI003D7C972D
MSLLWMDYETEFQNLVDTASECEQNKAPDYFSALSKRVKKIIYRDTRYNIDFLYTAYTLGDSKIMTDYAVWLFKLMDSIFTQKTSLETADYVIRHLDAIREAIDSTIEPEKQADLVRLLDLASDRIREVANQPATAENASPSGSANSSAPRFAVSTYEKEIQEYMDSLFQKNSRKTLYLIQKFTQQGIPINDIYVEILAESMRRVGELWHTAQITVDQEHYCTSVTQMAMAQMYPILFSNSEQRKNHLLLCACPGTELHEIGARMVADLFENDGGDSLYLGAAVPEDAMLDAIRVNHPDLVALSVTMPQHLIDCRNLITAIRQEFPNQKIAVGGNAFLSTNRLWEQWPIDFYTRDARQLLAQANTCFDGDSSLTS